VLPFEFVVDGPPVSQQARRRARVRRWTEEVRRSAAQDWPVGEFPEMGPIMLTIIYFYDAVEVDVDNILKPILDALKGLLYMDDNQIADILCRKRNLNSNLRIENPSSMLVDRFSRGKEFLYIVVEQAPDQEVIR
jgi:Holliday junction resolvase RusA-like endonuclease